MNAIAYPDAWRVTIRAPFTTSLSKNKATRFSKKTGHVYTPDPHAAAREAIQTAFAAVAAHQPVRVCKVWFRIHVWRPDMKSDPLNLIDGIADALKKAIHVDDRWFALAGLDWTPCTPGVDPRIVVDVWQEGGGDYLEASPPTRVVRPARGNGERVVGVQPDTRPLPERLRALARPATYRR